MNKLYLITTPGGYAWIDDVDPSDWIHEFDEDDEPKSSVVEATVENATVKTLLTGIEREQENANYHSIDPMCFIDILREVIDEDTVKEFLFRLVSEKGLLWWTK